MEKSVHLCARITFCSGFFVFIKNKMCKLKNRVGEKYITYQGYEVEVIEYIGSANCTVKFSDERGTIRKNVAVKELQSGSIKNLYRPDIFNVGFYGDGKYKAKIKGSMTKYYTTWFNMMSRCYQETNNRNKAYKDVTVCKEWHNFQNFAKWHEENYSPETMEDWFLDKDILCPTCREYSPKTCCFIPNEVNVFFSKNNKSSTGLPRGVYPKDGKYQSSISIFGKQTYLGFFTTIEEANEVYIREKMKYLNNIADKWDGVFSKDVIDAIRDFDISLL